MFFSVSLPVQHESGERIRLEHDGLRRIFEEDISAVLDDSRGRGAGGNADISAGVGRDAVQNSAGIYPKTCAGDHGVIHCAAAHIHFSALIDGDAIDHAAVEDIERAAVIDGRVGRGRPCMDRSPHPVQHEPGE